MSLSNAEREWLRVPDEYYQWDKPEPDREGICLDCKEWATVEVDDDGNEWSNCCSSKIETF